MDLSGIISVSGMGGLFKVISQTRSGLMIESLIDGKRMPVFSTHKISALEDISIYGLHDDIPLKDVFSAIKKANPAELPTAKDENHVINEAFEKFVPEYDEDRVYVSDMKKVFTWYKLLNEKGILELPEKEEEKKPAAEKESKPAKTTTAKPAAKTSAPKASSKGMAKTTTVRKTGA
ncbi:MAG: DUF5606 domain-containing protein [Bacteroidetes bacterium]|nr:DUF5606 domain-containing protein [Bacteroidota bacterium]